MQGTSLETHLQTFLETHDFLGRDHGAHFVVAYSGGLDSTALLYALSALKAENPQIEITPAYYWHPWRPLQEDFQIIHQHVKALGLTWVSLTPNLTLPKTEAAAREDRYQQLAALACDLQVTCILTAHHQDDQVETILFRLLRGTGIEGLVGIPPLREIVSASSPPVCLARPFLDLPRQILSDYIQQHGLHYVEDPTNQDTHFKRNRLRHEILPQIERAFPQVRESLIHLAALTRGELEIIESKMDAIWRDIVDPNSHTLDEVRFNQLAHPFQRRVIRRFLEEAQLDAGFQRVEEVIAFLAGVGRNLNRPGLFSLSATQFLTVYRNRIGIETPTKSAIDPLTVTFPSETSHLGFKATLSIRALTAEERMKPVDFNKLPPSQVYVDLSTLKTPEVTLRSRLKGDRIRPLGMTSPIKLKRFLINRAIPRFERDTIPVLAVDNEILWAVGVGLSENIRVINRPTHVMTLTRS